MKYRKLINLLALFVCCGLVLISGCAGTDTTATAVQDKMPITTSSEKAMEYYLQGRDLLEKLRNQESRQFFQQAVEADPEFAVAHLQLVAVQPSAKAAFESFYKAKALVDKVSEAEQLWITGFEAGFIEGDPIKQHQMYTKLVELYPNDERAHNLLATNYFARQDWEAAVVEYQQAEKINPKFSPVYNQMGYAMRFLGRYDDAEKAFKTYIEIIPNDPNPYDSYAELLMKIGRYDESIEQYQAALKVRSDFIASYFGIASNYNFKGEHAKAREYLKKLYDGAKDDGQRRAALTSMGLSYVDEQKFDQGIKEYQKQYKIAEAIGDTAAMAADLSLIAFTLVDMPGREKEALDFFKRANAMVQASSLSAATKEQNKLNSYFQNARAYIAAGNLEMAKTNAAEYRTKVIAAQNPLQIMASHQLDGLIALKEGKYDLALSELMKANQLNAYNMYFIAKAYEGKKDLANARVYYEKAANNNAINNAPQANIRARAAKLAKSI